MKVHAHIIMIYMILVGMCVIFYQRQLAISSIEVRDNQTDMRFTHEIVALRNDLSAMQVDHKGMLVEIRGNSDEDEHLKEEIHEMLKRVYLLEKRQLAAMELCKKERLK